MIDDVTRRQWRRMFDARTTGPWAPSAPHDQFNVMSVQYRRHVATFAYPEDCEMFRESYDGWPRTLEALEQAETNAAALRDELERLTADRREMASTLTELSRDLAVSMESAHIHEHAAANARASAMESAEACRRLAERVSELERMLDAWRKHRNSPLLLADHDNYKRRNE